MAASVAGTVTRTAGATNGAPIWDLNFFPACLFSVSRFCKRHVFRMTAYLIQRPLNFELRFVDAPFTVLDHGT